MSNDRDNEPFLSRWSRQKQQQARQPEAKQKAPVAAKPGEPEPEFDLSKLTKVEDLTAESDITQFLQKGVPEALQKLALRKMWSLDPAIRDFVEVAENQWDFNMPGGIHGLYQDLAEGTDTSVWMAQATQSVFGDDATKPIAVTDSHDVAEASGEPPAAIENVASQHLGEAVPDAPLIVASGGQYQPSVVGQTVEAKQAPVVAEKLSAPPKARSSESQPMRRRHGGALPA
jgi:Protein of unknown function (DUF3306)